MKNPLPQKATDNCPLLNLHQFASNQMCMAFGDGHNLVNWPINPRSVSLSAKGHAEGVNTATLGISTTFLTNREGGGLGALA
jgi:hypothetical protein